MDRKSASVLRAMLGVATLVLAFCGSASAQLRVVSWNTATTASGSYAARQTHFNRVLDYVGREEVNGFARDIDILILQEQRNDGTTLAAFANELNTITGTTDYVAWSETPFNSDGFQVGFVYNQATVQSILRTGAERTSRAAPGEWRCGRWATAPTPTSGYTIRTSKRARRRAIKRGDETSPSRTAGKPAMANREQAMASIPDKRGGPTSSARREPSSTLATSTSDRATKTPTTCIRPCWKILTKSTERASRPSRRRPRPLASAKPTTRSTRRVAGIQTPRSRPSHAEPARWQLRSHGRGNG